MSASGLLTSARGVGFASSLPNSFLFVVFASLPCNAYSLPIDAIFREASNPNVTETQKKEEEMRGMHDVVLS